MGILDNLSKEHLALFTKDQLLAIPDVAKASPHIPSSSKLMLLQENHRLTSKNWLQFQANFPAMLKEAELC
jgi:hypothetical protein